LNIQVRATFFVGGTKRMMSFLLVIC